LWIQIGRRRRGKKVLCQLVACPRHQTNNKVMFLGSFKSKHQNVARVYLQLHRDLPTLEKHVTSILKLKNKT
jgi:hypothetical protein